MSFTYVDVLLFQHFPRRSYHRFLTMIIHLQEISVSVAKENYKYGLLEQVNFLTIII
jgi:hypothetical protein